MRSGCLSGTHFSYPETKIRGVVPVSGPVSGPASGPASGPVSGLYPALHSYLSPCLPLRFCPPNRPCLRPLRSGLLFYLTARRTRCSAFRPWNSQGPQPAERTKKRRKRIAGRRREAAAREAPEAPPYAPPPITTAQPKNGAHPDCRTRSPTTRFSRRFGTESPLTAYCQNSSVRPLPEETGSGC